MILIEYSFYLLSSLVIASVFRYGFGMSADIAYFIVVFSFISIAFSGRIYCWLYDLFVEKKVIYSAEHEYGHLYRITEELSKHLSINMPRLIISDSVEICGIEGDSSKSLLYINIENIDDFTMAEMIGIISHELAHVKLNHTKFSSILCIPFIYAFYFIDFVSLVLENIITPVISIIPIVSFIWEIIRFVYLHIFEILKKLSLLLWQTISTMYYKLIEPMADRLTISIGTSDYLISALEKMDNGIEAPKLASLFASHKSPRDRILDLKKVSTNQISRMIKFNPYIKLAEFHDFNIYECALGQRIRNFSSFRADCPKLIPLSTGLAL